MEILLIIPQFNTEGSGDYILPLGIACVSAALKQSGYNVNILNLNHTKEDVVTTIQKEICAREYQMVATGATSIFFPMIKMIIDTVKSYDKNLVTVLGGGIITAAPMEIFSLLEPTFGIIGEGEQTIIELLTALKKRKKAAQIPGLIFKGEDESIIQTEPRQSIRDINKIPFPDYEGVGLYEHWGLQLQLQNKCRLILPLITSRSCPFDCTFCYHPLGRGYRQFELKGLFTKIEYLKTKKKFHHISIIDELFATNKKKVLEFCQEVRQIGVTWEAQLRVNVVDEEIVCAMREAGCRTIGYGIESMSQTVLDSMHKETSIIAVEKALKITYDQNVEIQGNLIFGDEAETMDTFMESLSWWMENRHYQIFLSAIRIYPGSVIYSRAVDCGLIDPMTFLPQGGGVVNITRMSPDEFTFMHLVTREISDSFLWLCSSYEFHTDAEGVVNSGQATCPKCGHSQAFENLQKSEGISYRTYGRRWWRFTCEACCARFDVPVSITTGSGNLEKEMLYLMSFADKGSFLNDIKRLYNQIRRDRIGINEIRSLGNQLESEGSIRDAYVCHTLFLRENPLDADCHEHVATLYDKMGYAQIGGWHCDEAIRIRNSRLDENFRLVSPNV